MHLSGYILLYILLSIAANMKGIMYDKLMGKTEMQYFWFCICSRYVLVCKRHRRGDLQKYAKHNNLLLLLWWWIWGFTLHFTDN